MTHSFWIADAQSRVLGPITLQILSELVSSGRLRTLAHVSLDGRQWIPASQLPEVVSTFQGAAQNRQAHEVQQAARIRSQFEALRKLPPHEIFRVAKEAPLEQYRAAFFRLIKRFHPDSVPGDAAPELRAVSAEVFKFLSGLMASIERQPPAAQRPPPPVLQQSAPREVRIAAIQPPPPGANAGPQLLGESAAAPAVMPEPARPPDEKGLPTYAAFEFMGLERRGEHRIWVELDVTLERCGVFNEHRLLNISTGGAFFPYDTTIPLGDTVDMELRFKSPDKTIKATGCVVWWSSGDAKQKRGFGVKFTRLAANDRKFIQEYVAKASTRHR